MQASHLQVNNAVHADSGFIMLDALLAVTIAALGLGIILTAAQISRKNSDGGQERHAALVRLQVLLESTRRIPSEHESKDEDFKSWVRVARVSEGQTSFCQIDAKLTSRRSKRSYQLNGLRWCASDVGGAQ